MCGALLVFANIKIIRKLQGACAAPGASESGVLPHRLAMPRAQPRFEAVDGLRVPLGGINGYKGVRGKQGRKKNKYQGVTPRKTHRTGHFDTAKEAAIAFAQLREDLELGMLEQRAPQTAQPPAANEPSKKAQVGVYLGTLLAQQRAVVPSARAWLLSPQQAAAALAGGMPQGFALAKA